MDINLFVNRDLNLMRFSCLVIDGNYWPPLSHWKRTVLVLLQKWSQAESNFRQLNACNKELLSSCFFFRLSEENVLWIHDWMWREKFVCAMLKLKGGGVNESPCAAIKRRLYFLQFAELQTRDDKRGTGVCCVSRRCTWEFQDTTAARDTDGLGPLHLCCHFKVLVFVFGICWSTQMVSTTSCSQIFLGLTACCAQNIHGERRIATSVCPESISAETHLLVLVITGTSLRLAAQCIKFCPTRAHCWSVWSDCGVWARNLVVLIRLLLNLMGCSV